MWKQNLYLFRNEEISRRNETYKTGYRMRNLGSHLLKSDFLQSQLCFADYGKYFDRGFSGSLNKR